MNKHTLAQLKRLKKNLREKPAVRTPAPKPVEPDARELFEQAMRGVVPLAHSRYPFPPKYPSPWPRDRTQEEAQNMAQAMTDLWPWDELASGEELLFMRPGVQHEALRKLRRGECPAQSELDLHGHTSDTARLEVATFLHACRQQGLRCVRIIHGKGLSSRNGEPVLKLRLKNWLSQREDVLAFCQARPAEGGSGAVLVLLKTQKDKSHKRPA